MSPLLPAANVQFYDYDLWCDSVNQVFVPIEVRPERRDRFRNEVATGMLGWIQVSEMRTTAQRALRSRAMADRAEEPGCKVTLQLQGQSEIRQEGRAALLRPGDWSLYDITRPYEVSVDEASHFLVLHMPGRQLDAWRADMRHAVARVFSAHHGCGRIAMDLLRSSLHEHDQLSRGAACHAADAVWQMMGAAVSEWSGGLAEPGSLELKQAQLHRVRRYVLDHLGDPDLTPASIAQAFRVSRRYLYKLFELADTTPASYILSERLARSHDMLGDESSPIRQVGEIAYLFGFSDAARFSHAFRARYGMSPTQWRRQRQRQALVS
ncbi:MAG: helix-turn-helix domain-containing protein [Pigmentiphaga sp.]|nr:helix-turn-helix domain-containing protein [Pigmentiphaga sp.]